MKIEKIRSKQDDIQIVHIKLQFDRKELTMQHTPFGIRLKLPGCFPAGELGGPEFPGKVVSVVLPSFTEAVKVVAIVHETNVLHKEPVFVAPLQKPQAGVCSPKDNEEDNVAHYQADEKELAALEQRIKTRSKQGAFEKRGKKQFEDVAPFPMPEIQIPRPELYKKALEEPMARIIETQQVGPNSIGVIEIRPLRYTQDEGIELCTDIEVVVYCAPVDATAKQDIAGPYRNAHQSIRIIDDLRARVINPAEIIDWSKVLPTLYECDYIIITDNYAWNAMTMTRGAFIGDQISEYRRLIEWKRRKGLSARLVTITSIRAGRYGDHSTGARDLQEVIRNFIKWVYHQWNISWVLLGGDIDIVPVRYAPGASEGHINVQTENDPPNNNQSFWTGTYLKMNVANPGIWWPGNWQNLLVNATTGTLIPYDAMGTAATGWCWCTDDTYETVAPMRTQFVKVNGPAAVVNARLQWLYQWNMIPTDFYYSSVDGPNYNLPGRHDWDLMDNGIYGQHIDGSELDGVNYRADVSVGRAPTGSAEQARVFVNKVIAYEQFRDPIGLRLDTSYLHRMALVSSNWGGRWWIEPDMNLPPRDFKYNHQAGEAYSIIKLPDSNFMLSFNYNLLVFISENDIRVLPYNDTGGRGWYFCRAADDLEVNGLRMDISPTGVFFPMPSPWIAVRGAAEELTPRWYIFDSGDADGSMADQETLRVQVDNELPFITEFDRVYEDDIDLTPAERAAAPIARLSSTTLLNALNARPHFVSLSGHGDGGGCCHYRDTVVNATTNGLHTYIVFADSCLTNEYDGSDAISELSLHHPSGGAVGYVGNSRFSWIGVGDNFQRAFFRRLTTPCRLGDLNDTRVGMVNEATGFYRLYNKWVVYAQNLMGDPEMPIWTREPFRIVVDFPLEWNLRNALVIHAAERNVSIPSPLPGAHVHLQQGYAHSSGKADKAGNITLDLTGFSEGPAEITISKMGYKPMVAQINMLASSWVTGKVKFIHHQEGSATTTEIGLQVGTGDAADTKVFRATKELPDYAIILDAATDAFVSGKEISFYVSLGKEQSDIEKFRFDSSENQEDKK